MHSKTFPKYFLVDHEIYVKVYFDNDGALVAVNDLGNKFQPYKAMTDGVEISQKDFEAGAVQRKKDYPKVINPTARP